MKQLILVSALALGLTALTACEVKTPDVNKDIKIKIDKIKFDIDAMTSQGGQPGQIRVSGAPVSENNLVESRVSVTANTGIGKDGKEYFVGKLYLPVFEALDPKLDLTSQEKSNSLIAVGCNPEYVNNYAQVKSLVVEQLTAPIIESMRSLSANTVILCGSDLSELNLTSMLTISANEIILDSVEFTKTGINGFFNLATNSLVLIGSNTISSRGPDSSLAVFSGPSMSLQVVKEVTGSEDGKLALKAFGGNYKAEEKTAK